jgi:hypothetical protein
VRLPIPPPPQFDYFLGLCAGGAGAGAVCPDLGTSTGIVVFDFLPSDSVLSDTEGCAPPGAGADDWGAGIAGGCCEGVCPVFAGADAGAFDLSNTVFPPTEPAFRVAKIESDSEVIMKTTAETVVALESSVADPRGPKAVCEPMPPKAPARSAAFPLCNRTTMIRKTQTSTWRIVRRTNSMVVTFSIEKGPYPGQTHALMASSATAARPVVRREVPEDAAGLSSCDGHRDPSRTVSLAFTLRNSLWLRFDSNATVCLNQKKRCSSVAQW